MSRVFIRKIVFIFLVVFHQNSACFSLSKTGQTEVLTYTRNQYGAGAQNWAIKQDKKNRLYIANNEGLLVFNGSSWQIFPVPNKTILRSIGFGSDGKLYAGAQDEFGYFAPDPVGRLCYTSLKYLLPASEMKFPDVWQIESLGTEVFFRTNTTIFRYANQKLNTYRSRSGWLSIHKHQDRILAHDAGQGLLLFQNGKWKTLVGKAELPNRFFITDLVAYSKDTSLLCTERHGLFYLIGDKLSRFNIQSPGVDHLQHFTSLSILEDTSILLGTYFNGIYLISKKGVVKENVSTKNGLGNNTIRCLYADRYGNAWVGLDNGIALFNYQNTIKHLNPAAFNNGVGYGVQLLNNDLYFALSTGLYCLPLRSENDVNLENYAPKIILGGLTWNISVFDKQILAGRDDGFWKINNYLASPVSQRTGFWTFKPVKGNKVPQLAAGSYLGVHLFEKENDYFFDKDSITDFTESSRYLETDDKNIWVSHPYRGIYKISISDGSVVLFTQKEGLPSDLDNHVFKIKNQILFATTKGIYEYNSLEGKVLKSKQYENLFGELPIRYLKDDEKGNIWFVQEKMVGVADFSKSKPVVHYLPELKNKVVSGFESIFPYHNGNVLVGSETGFYHVDYSQYLKGIKTFSAYLTQVKSIGKADSVFWGGYSLNDTSPGSTISLPYKYNSLHFGFAVSDYDHQANNEFSYYLDGFDLTWSKWTNKFEKEYTNLPAGNYTLQLKARKSPSHESAVYTYSFTIEPPFYQTIWAYAFYALVFSGFVYGLLKFQSKRHKKKLEAKRLSDQQQFEEEQRQMAFQHQLELGKSEKELIRLQNEKLEGEIEFKNAELASATMNLVQKRVFILKLKTELSHLQKTTKVGDDNPELKKLIKTLSEEEKLNTEWDQFSQHFNSVHGDFINILKARFPSLKPHEMQLCAYLRMNLSSKDIAPLMSISVRGVEIGRYRLRKKLGLATEENLAQFLLDLKVSV